MATLDAGLEADVEETELLESSKIDAQIAEVKRQMAELEEAKASAAAAVGQVPQDEGVSEADLMSVYVGQVDYGVQPEELADLFKEVGLVRRVTVLCDKFTGQSKGFAYVEFTERAAAEAAVARFDGHQFKGRTLKVLPKRTNIRGRGRVA
eukprot:Hpha_TRINITY_DN23719_c0_g1::TRINITY_DN23719_c0_g1_i1::g.93162::m.93162/K14396/PABPN1, PABP2; polyadenylate-binding protein 2